MIKIVSPRYYTLSPKGVRGFTLAELLIALAIVAVIVTFTIPKIVTGLSNVQKKTVFKSTLSDISTVFYSSIQKGELLNNYTQSNWLNFWTTHLNYVSADNCGSSCVGGAPSWYFQSSTTQIKLHNGAMITTNLPGQSGYPYYSMYFYVDYNGAEAPNLEGQDIIGIVFCWDSNYTRQSPYAWAFGSNYYGSLIYSDATLVDWIFSQ